MSVYKIVTAASSSSICILLITIQSMYVQGITMQLTLIRIYTLIRCIYHQRFYIKHSDYVRYIYCVIMNSTETFSFFQAYDCSLPHPSSPATTAPIGSWSIWHGSIHCLSDVWNLLPGKYRRDFHGLFFVLLNCDILWITLPVCRTIQNLTTLSRPWE